MPAMHSSCATPIKGRFMRVVALDGCGVPVTGTGGLVVVTKGFVSVAAETQYEDGEEFFERTADGSACVNQKDDPTLKRVQLTIQMCEVNVTATAYIASARELATGSPTTGTGFAVSEGNPTNRYSLEVWQEVAGSGACDASGNQRYIYHAWPNVGATKIGNYDIQNGRSTVELTSETRAASPLWAARLGTPWLPAGEVVEDNDHWLWNITTTPLPTAACDPTLLAA